MKRPNARDYRGDGSEYDYTTDLNAYIDYLEAELEETDRELTTRDLAAAETTPSQPDPRDEMIRNLTSELATAQARLYSIGLLAR